MVLLCVFELCEDPTADAEAGRAAALCRDMLEASRMSKDGSPSSFGRASYGQPFESLRV